MTGAEHLQVSVTIDSRQAAVALARAAVTARLAACAQVSGPLTSVYWWDESVNEDTEWIVHLKTSATRYAELEALLRREHGYDVPEIVAVPIVAGNPDYLSWVTTETTTAGPGGRARGE